MYRLKILGLISFTMQLSMLAIATSSEIEIPDQEEGDRAPTVTLLAPNAGQAGQTILVHGSGFKSPMGMPWVTRVRFGLLFDSPSYSVLSVSLVRSGTQPHYGDHFG